MQILEFVYLYSLLTYVDWKQTIEIYQQGEKLSKPRVESFTVQSVNFRIKPIFNLIKYSPQEHNALVS
jgi:hypothetical protein